MAESPPMDSSAALPWKNSYLCPGQLTICFISACLKSPLFRKKMQEMEYSFCADGVRKTDHLFLAGNRAPAF